MDSLAVSVKAGLSVKERLSLFESAITQGRAVVVESALGWAWIAPAAVHRLVARLRERVEGGETAC